MSNKIQIENVVELADIPSARIMISVLAYAFSETDLMILAQI